MSTFSKVFIVIGSLIVICCMGLMVFMLLLPEKAESTFIHIVTHTPRPSPLPTLPFPTQAPPPTKTTTPIPTDTVAPLPNDTSTPLPTDTVAPTSIPTETATQVPLPTISPLIGKSVTLVCVDYCTPERKVNLLSSTGRSGVVVSVAEGTTAEVLSSQIGEQSSLIFFEVRVNGQTGWVREAEVKP